MDLTISLHIIAMKNLWTRGLIIIVICTIFLITIFKVKCQSNKNEYVFSRKTSLQLIEVSLRKELDSIKYHYTIEKGFKEVPYEVLNSYFNEVYLNYPKINSIKYNKINGYIKVYWDD